MPAYRQTFECPLLFFLVFNKVKVLDLAFIIKVQPNHTEAQLLQVSRAIETLVK